MSENLNELEGGMKRRSVIKAAAWAAPVVAVAVSAPIAAASGEPPAAVYAGLGGPATPPKVGENATFRGWGEDAHRDTPATLQQGTIFTLTFTNGATASQGTLTGLTLFSGDPTAGGVVEYVVSADTSAQVVIRLSNVQPEGGVITLTSSMGGSVPTTIQAA
ncbi:MAG: hypothetical protein ACK5LO_06700 [Leucobacter sp.]